jgi:cytochrome c oxidase assembly factor CtaG
VTGAAWSWDPLVLTALLVGSWWYWTGLRTLRRSGMVSRLQPAAFAAGVGLTAVALVSPLDALSEQLLSAHMTQHVLLTLVVAPLLVLSSPLQTMAWGLPPLLRRRIGRWQGRIRRLLSHPALPGAGLALFTVVFTTWHIPPLYDAALTSDPVHALEHTTMLAAALAMWAPIVRPRRTPAGAGVLLLFISLIASGILAALLVFSPTPWYAHPATADWGITRLADQQLAGAVMWVVGGTIYVVAGALVLMRWLHADERAIERRERALG